MNMTSDERILEHRCLDIKFNPPSSMNFWNVTTWQEEQLDVEFRYYFFHENGVLIQTMSKISSTICYNDSECHYLLLSGHSSYEIHTEDAVKRGEITYDNPSLIRIGKCSHNCEKSKKLIIAGELGDDYIIYNSNEIIKEEIFTKPSLRNICVKTLKCYKLGGKVAYLVSQDDSELEVGSTHLGIKVIEENCRSKCSKKPILTESTRGQQITLVLSGSSDMNLLMDKRTNHYKAACWIIYDDPLQVDQFNYTHIEQRYVLSLLYFSTGGKNWLHQLNFLSSKNECDWHTLIYDGWGYYETGVYCKSGIVTSIQIGE